jgi:hypothetical protein
MDEIPPFPQILAAEKISPAHAPAAVKGMMAGNKFPSSAQRKRICDPCACRVQARLASGAHQKRNWYSFPLPSQTEEYELLQKNAIRFLRSNLNAC